MKTKLLAVILLLTASIYQLDAQTTRYVSMAGAGNFNGSAWMNASSNLQDMINASSNGDFIWVVKGSYKPSTLNDRNATFILKKGVKIYGGFAGNETQLEDRNISTNPTILSGDIGAVGSNSDNCYHVVTSVGDVGKAELNGFWITGGCAATTSSSTTSAGAGIYISSSSPTINNCSIYDNTASENGGGIYIIGTAATKSSASIVNCNIINNKSENGGGIYNDNNSSSYIVNCNIVSNKGTENGGGIYTKDNINIYNSIFWLNKKNGSDDTAGADIETNNSSLILTINYCLTQKYSGNQVSNVINDKDPGFQNLNTNNLKLSAGSPCINAGNNSYYNSNIYGDKDLSGNTRKFDNTIDIGAYERQKKQQTITAGNISKTYGDADFTHGKASSNVSLTYTSGNTAVAKIVNDKIHIEGVGTATITVRQAGNTTYDPASKDFTLTVNKKALTVTAEDKTKTYDGAIFPTSDYSVTYSGFVNSETASVLGGAIAYGGASKTAKNVGSYTITPSGLTSSNYDITYNGGKLEITKAPLSIIAENKSKTYDGKIFPTANYSVTYSGFVNSETSSVLSGTVSYGGASKTAKNVGTYAITPSGLTSSNYDITFTNGSLTIGKAALTITAEDKTKTYDGAIFPASDYSVTYSGFVNSETSSVLNGTVSYGGASKTAKNVGSYTITPSGLTSGNYDITFTNGSLTISKAALTVTAEDKTKTYDGAIFSTSDYSVTYSGFVNSETSSVLNGTVSYGGASKTAKNVGSYTITPSGLTSGNYDITFTNGSLTISKAALTVTAEDKTKTYDGAIFSTSDYSVTYSGFVNSETSSVLNGTVSYGGASKTAKNVGSYTITPSGLTSGNYDITFTNGSLTISKAALTVTAEDKTKTYDGAIFPTSDYSVTYSGFVNSETASVLGGAIAYGGASKTAKNVGSYTITPSGLTSGNYDITYNGGKLEITKAPLSIIAENKSKTYDGKIFHRSNYNLAYSGFVAGENSQVLNGKISYGGESQSAINVGNYEIIPGGLTSNNYDITYQNGNLEINKVEINVTADANQGKEYGTADPNLTYTVRPKLISGDNFTGTLTRTVGEAIGTYDITQGNLSAGNNYAITYHLTEKFSITRRNITVRVKSNQNKVYANSDPVFDYTIAPKLVGSDKFTGKLEREQGENVGNYAINIGSLKANDKYIITFESNDFEITPKPIIINAKKNQNKIYGDSDPAFGYTSNEKLEKGNNFTGKLSRKSGEDVGIYEITLGDLSAGNNYKINFISEDFKINVKPITVTVDANQGKTYGDAEPELSYKCSSKLSFSDDFSGILNRESNKNVGTYAITQGSLTAGSNYRITFVGNNFEIKPKLITVTAIQNQSKIYGTADPELRYSYSPNLEKDDKFTGELNRISGEYIGKYTIRQGSLHLSDNYKIKFITSIFTIKKTKIGDVIFNNKTVNYDGKVHSLFVESDLPDDVKITYVNNDKIDVGIYTVKAIIKGENYGQKTLTASLKINKSNITNIKFNDRTVVYSGKPQSVQLLGNLPAGSNVHYNNNSNVDVGTYTVIAYIDGGLNYYNKELTANITIKQAEIEGVKLTDGNTIFDGKVHSLTITGNLPETAKVSYQNNDKIEAGIYEVKANIENGKNYKVKTLNAKLIINKAEISGINLSNRTINYDGKSHSLSISGKLPEGTTVTYLNNNKTKIGEHKVTANITGGKNYKNLSLTAILEIKSTTGIEQAKIDKQVIKVYPNPVSGGTKFFVKINNSEKELKGAILELQNLEGKTIQKISQVFKITKISAPNKAGVYILSVSKVNGHKTNIKLLVK